MKTKGILTATVLSAVLLVIAGCGDDSDNNSSNGTSGFGDCTDDRNGWQQCKDNKVQYCHVVSGMDPHFHWGTDCQALGLTCVNIDDQGQAACVDESKTCAAADEKCDNNTAYFCVNGKLGQEPCGTAKECHADGDRPHCEEKSSECSGHGHLHGGACHCDKGYKQDPADKTKCVPEVDFPTLACNEFSATATGENAVETFSDFSKAHMDLDKPYDVTLPDNQPSYVHFPVTQSGEYVIFLNEASLFDTFMHRGDQDVSPPPAGGVPNGKCSSEIKDHWHADLVFDADVGADKVPYIVRFKPISGGKTVKVMVKRKPTEVEFPLASCDLFRASPKSETVVEAFADFKNAHADLDTPYEVALPDNKPSYVHFPVDETGEYVIFLSEPDAFDTFMHRSEKDASPPPAGGVANGKCSTLIKDHWHADLTFDGGTGDTKVPYIVRFKAVAGGKTLTFMVRKKH